jgi:hypothetical protein
MGFGRATAGTQKDRVRTFSEYMREEGAICKGPRPTLEELVARAPHKSRPGEGEHLEAHGAAHALSARNTDEPFAVLDVISRASFTIDKASLKDVCKLVKSDASDFLKCSKSFCARAIWATCRIRNSP